jgi:hypothetical protein
MKPPPGGVLWVAAGTVVLGAVVLGLLVLGGPEEERARRLDDRRVTDLVGISVAIDLYWTRHMRLPESLDVLASEPGVRISVTDPIDTEVYEYRALDDVRYEVCARFAEGSTGMSAAPVAAPEIFQQSCSVCHGPAFAAREDSVVAAHARRRQLWAHESGRQCFELSPNPISRRDEDGGR